jgi:hypothetical protein
MRELERKEYSLHPLIPRLKLSRSAEESSSASCCDCPLETVDGRQLTSCAPFHICAREACFSLLTDWSRGRIDSRSHYGEAQIMPPVIHVCRLIRRNHRCGNFFESLIERDSNRIEAPPASRVCTLTATSRNDPEDGKTITGPARMPVLHPKNGLKSIS